DVTSTYDKYDMLLEKRLVASILEAELRKIVGTKPVSRGLLPIARDNVVQIVDVERRIMGL
ncbi:hypothetical protein, partial [Bradyrhizobium ottawaense]